MAAQSQNIEVLGKYIAECINTPNKQKQIRMAICEYILYTNQFLIDKELLKREQIIQFIAQPLKEMP